jgi:uncharacterized protein YecE (DUF72 family)
MEEGRSLAGVDFSLPPVDPLVRRVLASGARGRRAGPPRVHVGAPQWGVREWLGHVYPPGARAGDWLAHYARQLNTVELNATHYGTPTPAVLRRWRESAPPGFTFAPKFPRAVSHAEDLGRVADAAREFCARMSEGLQDRLGRAFLQLPPQFGPARIGELAALLHALPRDFPLAVEARNPRLFHERRLTPTLAALLHARGAGAVVTDTPGRREVSHGTLTAPTLLLRFVGTGAPAVDARRADAWARRLARLLALGLEEVHVFVHMPSPLLAAEACNGWVHRLNAACGLRLAPWQPGGGGEGAARGAAPAGEGAQLSLWG